MDLIDDRGRLLGVVNVVDAFVVLVVVAVLAAGVGFVLSEGGTLSANRQTTGSEHATRYATIDLGSQPSYLAALISAGDTARTGNGEGLSITDVYVGPTGGRSATVVVRAALRGRATSDGDGILVGGSRLRSGRSFSLDTGEYAVEGTVTSVGRDDASLPMEEIPLLLETTMSTSIAETIEVGDTYRLADRTIATVQSVRTVPTVDPTERRVFLGVTVRTISHSPTRFFGVHPVTLGGTLPVRTPNYSVSGRVLRLGSTSLPGTPVRTTARIEIANLSADLADNLRTGMRETNDGTTLARVTDRRVEPATTQPNKREVTLTVSLRTRETGAGLQFHGRPLHEGTRVVLDFGTIRVRGTVVDIEG